MSTGERWGIKRFTRASTWGPAAAAQETKVSPQPGLGSHHPMPTHSGTDHSSFRPWGRRLCGLRVARPVLSGGGQHILRAVGGHRVSRKGGEPTFLPFRSADASAPRVSILPARGPGPCPGARKTPSQYTLGLGHPDQLSPRGQGALS